MAYTFNTKPTPTYATTGELDEFSTQVKDGSHEAVGASGIQTTDATTSAVKSPVTVSTAAVLINIPPNASQINLIGLAGFSFSEVSTLTSAASAANAVAVPASVLISLPVARQTALYLIAGTSTTVSFWFNII